MPVVHLDEIAYPFRRLFLNVCVEFGYKRNMQWFKMYVCCERGI